MFKKNRTLVIMDGSDVYKVRLVLNAVKVYGGDKCIKEYRRLDSEHPTMKVIKYRANRKASDNIKRSLNRLLPGLCVYDVAV